MPQDVLFENRVDPTGGGIRDGGQVHPGARLRHGAGQGHEAARFALSGSGPCGRMSDKRHGWSPVMKRSTTPHVSCPSAWLMLHCTIWSRVDGEGGCPARLRYALGAW